MTVAKWLNENRTKAVMLDSDGTVSFIHRENSGQIWSPPEKLEPYAFEVKPDDRCNLVGVTWHR